MRFKFKLESVLSHVKMKEERIQQEFSVITLRHREAMDELEGLKQRLLTENCSLELNTSFVLLKEAYIDRLSNEVDAQKQVIVKLEAEKCDCQKRVIETVKERKILEKLKDRHKAEFQSQLALLEQKALDEQALIAFQRC